MKGIVAVKGMAVAKVHIVEGFTCDIEKYTVKNIDEEICRLNVAIEKCENQLEAITSSMSPEIDEKNMEIFDFQLLMLSDKEFIGCMESIIIKESLCCEYAVDVAAKEFIKSLESLDNTYLNERSSDILDLSSRLKMALLGKEYLPETIKENCIVVSEDLAPSQVVQLDKEFVKGIVLEKGGSSSHCVILARSMGIPCIIGVTDILEKVNSRDILLLDGDAQEVLINPPQKDIDRYADYEKKVLYQQKILEEFKQRETITTDGYKMGVYANITSKAELQLLAEQGAEGVGLLRTELMYMESNSPPSEEYQFKFYRNIAMELKDKPLIIRTLDVGGDKEIKYLNMPKEDNPFLGHRAIRYCLENEDIFKTQISAILRSSTQGNVYLMLPMVSMVEEVQRTKVLIEDVKKDLYSRSIKFAENLSVGMMIETPASVIMAAEFAKVVDFFSIGTNDLTQYLYTADRTNKKVAKYNSPTNPAVLRGIKYVCDCAHKENIEVDICGQAGEQIELIPLWVAMGVNNLSVSIPSVTKVRRQICKLNKKACIELMNRVLKADNADEIATILKLVGEEEVYAYRKNFGGK